MLRIVKNTLRPVRNAARRLSDPFNIVKRRRETNALYAMLYNLVHDLDNSLDYSARQTQGAFSTQWGEFEEGTYLIKSDPWFRENSVKILCEQELRIRPEWFRGKRVLDAGCGNGRWAYPLAKLGARYTAVDINEVAIAKTRELIAEFDIEKNFIVSPLETVLEKLSPSEPFDLVLSWGVVHHTRSFNASLDNLTRLVRPGGVLHLYLYGRETLSYQADIELFKERVRYHTLLTDEERYQFLLAKVKGRRNLVHAAHDAYAPLINRRLDFDYVQGFLEERGFTDVIRTIDNPELFIRSFKGAVADLEAYLLPPSKEPAWILHHS